MGKFELITFANAGQLADEVAEAWLEEIGCAWLAGRPHFVALLGGRIASTFFDSVVRATKLHRASFGHVHFFWSDERCVPPEDSQSNFRLAERHLLGPLGISSAQIHRIRTELGPVAAAADAEAELRNIVPVNADGQPVLDLVFLGMGEDGHIASLFPGEPADVAGSSAVYRAVTGPKPPYARVTMGYQTLAAAQGVWVLVAGEGKAAALRASLGRAGDTPLARLLALRPLTRVYAELGLVQDPHNDLLTRIFF